MEGQDKIIVTSQTPGIGLFTADETPVPAKRRLAQNGQKGTLPPPNRLAGVSLLTAYWVASYWSDAEKMIRMVNLMGAGFSRWPFFFAQVAVVGAVLRALRCLEHQKAFEVYENAPKATYRVITENRGAVGRQIALNCFIALANVGWYIKVVWGCPFCRKLGAFCVSGIFFKEKRTFSRGEKKNSHRNSTTFWSPSQKAHNRPAES